MQNLKKTFLQHFKIIFLFFEPTQSCFVYVEALHPIQQYSGKSGKPILWLGNKQTLSSVLSLPTGKFCKLFYCLLIFFKNTFLKKTSECKIDLIQIRPHFCGPDLGPNYLQKLSEDDKSHGNQGKDFKVTLVDKQLNLSLFMFLNDLVNVLKFWTFFSIWPEVIKLFHVQLNWAWNFNCS